MTVDDFEIGDRVYYLGGYPDAPQEWGVVTSKNDKNVFVNFYPESQDFGVACTPSDLHHPELDFDPNLVSAF